MPGLFYGRIAEKDIPLTLPRFNLLHPMRMLIRNCSFLVVLLSLLTMQSQAQEYKKSYLGFVGNGSLYFSWGYNTEWYTRSTIHVSQPSQNTEYELINVKAHDHRGWDEGLFQKALTIPQYNYRLGYFFNEKQDFAIEINFDHTKYIVTDGQRVHLKGKLNGEKVDRYIDYSGQNGFYYFLNNGANFLLFNLVKRFQVYHTDDKKFKIDLLTKAGVGPVIPHVENAFFGKQNDPDFQIGGWNMGLEAAVRITGMKYAYLEFAQKVDYARYSNLHIYEGNVRQSFGTYELILSLGINIPTGKNNPQYKSKAYLQSLEAAKQ